MNALASGRPKICFVSPTNYSVLSGDRTLRQVGGAEVQQATLAREFVRRGYEVSMICLNHGQADGVVIDGITVHRAHTPDGGLPVLRFIHPRLTSIWAAMRRANADIYYQRTAASLSAEVVAFSKMHRRLSVYAAASDRDFLPDTPHVQYARDRALYRWALRRADLVVTQTASQRDACERNFGRAPTVIRSCYGHVGKPANGSGTILWVANLARHKRPEMFVELARRLPQHRFKIVGGADPAALEALHRRADGLSNIDFTGFVPFVDVEQHFDEGAMLINTSTDEGFPNTFLQAWSRGMPTVSFFDPGAEHDGQRVGSVVQTFDEMVDQVQVLKTQTAVWAAHSARAKAYFGATFTVAAAVDAYENAFVQARKPATLLPSIR